MKPRSRMLMIAERRDAWQAAVAVLAAGPTPGMPEVTSVRGLQRLQLLPDERPDRVQRSTEAATGY